MKILSIDTASNLCTVAILEDKKCIKEIVVNDARNHSEKIMPVIEQALQETSLNLSNIDLIVCDKGPGSFTGIRVGLTVAKTMAWSLKVPIVPISSLEVIASGTPATNNIALIDARRGFVYAGGYNENLDNTFTDRHILLENITELGTYVSYDELPNTIKPNIDVLKVIKKHEKENGINPHSINPNYLKLTEAEENLKKKND